MSGGSRGETQAAHPGILGWILAVYLISFGCYVPMLLERSGVKIPGGLLTLRYGFVLAPALVSAVFLLGERGLRPWLRQSFKAVSLKEAAVCLLAALLGIMVTAACSRPGEADLFRAAYPSTAALAAGCVYLFATAVVEEAAWRGFLFRRVAAGRGVLTRAGLSGVIWAVWHIPMWTIRNALGLADIVPLLIWAVLISIVLGIFFDSFGNVLSAALLHAVFNVCFLAPIQYNIALLLLSVFTGGILKKRAGADPAQGAPGEWRKGVTMLEEIIAIVRQAGEIVLSAHDIAARTHEKTSAADLVTEYDLAVENFLKEKLPPLVPGSIFFGEEEAENADPTCGWAFIVDPIDGTTNFVRGMKQSAISVALAHDGAVECAVVYDPFKNELFSARRGGGAFLNGSPIHVSALPLDRGVFGMGTAIYRREYLEPTLRLTEQLFRRSCDFRRMGAAALDLCAVACGRTELFFEYSLCPWDHAAGALVLTEAGGFACTLTGEPLSLTDRCSVWASNRVNKDLLRELEV